MRFGRVALAALGIGVGVAGMLHSGTGLKAEVIAMRAAQFAASGQWPLAHAAAERAAAMNPGEYRYLERVAEAEGQLGLQRKAQRHWREAALGRPSWPYVWAQLANSQLQSGDVGVDGSLRAVAATGDQERGLWELFAKLSLIYSEQPLTAFSRQWMDERLERELRNHGEQLFGYAFTKRREQALCSKVGDLERYRDWCNQARFVRLTCDVAEPLPSAQQQWCVQVEQLWQYLAYPAK